MTKPSKIHACLLLAIYFRKFHAWETMVFLILFSSLTENLDQSGEEGFISGIECSAFPFS